MVAATFHRRRLLPLTQRRLRLDEMMSEASLERSRMSHESLSLDEVTRRARWMVGSFRQEYIDRVLMRPTQGFEPLVSVVFDDLKFFCFRIPSTNSVEECVQDLSAVKETRPLVLEDRVAREARRLLATQKEENDAAKKCQVRKALEQEALKKRRRQQSLDGLPLEESSFDTVSGEDDDSDDDGAWSWYDTATSLAHLPNVRPFLEPIGGLTSHASRGASAPVEGKGEPREREREARARPSAGGATSSGAPQEGLVAPRAQTVVGAAASASKAGAPLMSVRTRGQLASAAQRTLDAPLARAPRSARLAGGSTVGPSQAPPGGSGLLGSRPLVPLSG
jgi:hypothetical protein